MSDTLIHKPTLEFIRREVTAMRTELLALRDAPHPVVRGAGEIADDVLSMVDSHLAALLIKPPAPPACTACAEKAAAAEGPAS